MRILIVNTFYYPNMQGGAEQSVVLLAENLKKRGHEVSIYCADSKDGKRTEECINGIFVYRGTTGKFDLYKYSYNKENVGAVEKITQKLCSYFNSTVEKEFQEICDKFRPDIIHTNSLYGIPRSIWKIANKKNIAVVHTIRDTSIISPVQYGHKINKVVLNAYQMYIRQASRYVDAVTAPSEYTLNTSLNTGAFGNAKVRECVYNSVQIDYELLERMINERKGRSSGIIKFLFVGRLIYLKGIRQMMEAFAKVNSLRCELHICGSGEMSDYVRQQASKDNRIIYYGKLDSVKLAEQYKECDVLLFPSVWPEPFGRVFIEGNMYGMPVIAGNCGGIPEIYAVTHGGVLCDCENVNNLAEEMKKFLDREYCNQFSENIIRGIESFDIRKQIDSFERIYNCII